MKTLKLYGNKTNRLIECDVKFKEALDESELIMTLGVETPTMYYQEEDTHLILAIIEDKVEEEKIVETSDGWLGTTLLGIIKDYKDGDDEPLDGDSVDKLIKIIKAKINLQEGNITEKEYDEILG